LVAKNAVKSGSELSYVSFLVKDLLKLRTTLGNTSFFHSALKIAPKKLLALKSFLTNLGNVATVCNETHWHRTEGNVDYKYTRREMGNRWKHSGIREDNQTGDT